MPARFSPVIATTRPAGLATRMASREYARRRSSSRDSVRFAITTTSKMSVSSGSMAGGASTNSTSAPAAAAASSIERLLRRSAADDHRSRPFSPVTAAHAAARARDWTCRSRAASRRRADRPSPRRFPARVTAVRNHRNMSPNDIVFGRDTGVSYQIRRGETRHSARWSRRGFHDNNCGHHGGAKRHRETHWIAHRDGHDPAWKANGEPNAEDS